MKMMMTLVAIMMLTGSGSAGNERRVTRSRDGSRNLVELSGGQANVRVRHVLEDDEDLKSAEQMLRGRGYLPLGAAVSYTEKIDNRKDNINDVEVVFWAWEDFNPETATGIVMARNLNNRRAEITIVQLRRDGEEVFRKETIRGGLKKNVLFDERGFYRCASVGCGGAMIVSFLFSAGAGFAPACTGVLFGCAYQAIG